MSTTGSSTGLSTPFSASASTSSGVHTVALKLPKSWAAWDVLLNCKNAKDGVSNPMFDELLKHCGDPRLENSTWRVEGVELSEGFLEGLVGQLVRRKLDEVHYLSCICKTQSRDAVVKLCEAASKSSDSKLSFHLGKP